MIFHENRLLALFFKNLGKKSQNLSSAAVVIGALRVNYYSGGLSSLMYVLLSLSDATLCDKN